jgi:hypothetical protein
LYTRSAIYFIQSSTDLTRSDASASLTRSDIYSNSAFTKAETRGGPTVLISLGPDLTQCDSARRKDAEGPSFRWVCNRRRPPGSLPGGSHPPTPRLEHKAEARFSRGRVSITRRLPFPKLSGCAAARRRGPWRLSSSVWLLAGHPARSAARDVTHQSRQQTVTAPAADAPGGLQLLSTKQLVSRPVKLDEKARLQV